ncbi:MAG TPA: hypothetical protein VIC84_06845 [Blastocatellia bacterium]|jgi:nucleoid-associated protein YgaU
MAEETKAVAEETAVTAGETQPEADESAGASTDVTEESFEQKQARLEAEDFIRRNEEAMAARREVLERNGLKYEDHTVTVNAEGVISLPKCCS